MAARCCENTPRNKEVGYYLSKRKSPKRVLMILGAIKSMKMIVVDDCCWKVESKKSGKGSEESVRKNKKEGGTRRF